MRNPSNDGVRRIDLLAHSLRAGEKETMRRFFIFVVFLFSLALRAELPPSAYESMQASAMEFLDVEILRVDIEPGDAPNQQKVLLLALVNKVTRTAANLKVGDLINIAYAVTDQPKRTLGAGEIPIPSEKDKTIAYLTKDAKSDNYLPAAGAMTFRNF